MGKFKLNEFQLEYLVNLSKFGFTELYHSFSWVSSDKDKLKGTKKGIHCILLERTQTISMDMINIIQIDESQNGFIHLTINFEII